MGNGSRKPHSKSRNSCAQCKKRRVKCNQQGPICSNCQRRGDPCDFHSVCIPSRQDDNADRLASSKSPKGLNKIITDTRLQTYVIKAPTNILWSILPPIHAKPHECLGFIDHFVWAPDRLPDVPAHRAQCIWSFPFSHESSLWIDEFNRLASNFDYLQRCFTALAALRVWYQQRSSGESAVAWSTTDLYAEACQRHIDASSTFRKSATRVTEQNWLAMLSFGISVIIFQFVTTEQPQPGDDIDQDAGKDYLSMFLVLRDSAKLFQHVRPFFLGSRFMRFMQSHISYGEAIVDPSIPPALEQLRRLCYFWAIPVEDRTVYEEAVGKLAAWVARTKGRPRVWGDFVWWPAVVAPEFVERLQARHPAARIVFLYWCAFMHKTPHRWFLEGWARRTAARALAGLTAEWAAFLHWPRDQLAREPGSCGLDGLIDDDEVFLRPSYEVSNGWLPQAPSLLGSREEHGEK